MSALAHIFENAATDGEAALLARLRAGDEQAFAWLIAQYHQTIYSLVARSLRDPAEAADVTQEVFLKVLRGIAKFNGDASLKTWIYRIALHETSNRQRWWSRHKSCEVGLEAAMDAGQDAAFTVGETLADASSTPFDCAAQAEMRLRVEQALRRIPKIFRDAVVLRDVEGLAYDEIAEVLEVSLGTVKSRILRGRAALKQQLLQAEEQRALRQQHLREVPA